MALEAAFANFTHDAPQMDGRTFIKVCKDCKLFCKLYTATDGDLIFAKVKQRGAKFITYPEFEQAMMQVAERKKIGFPELIKFINDNQGPVYNATVALPNKFHDDKSLYTGVYANGGPSTIDGGKDLSNLLDRTPADVRGLKM